MSLECSLSSPKRVDEIHAEPSRSNVADAAQELFEYRTCVCKFGPAALHKVEKLYRARHSCSRRPDPHWTDGGARLPAGVNTAIEWSLSCKSLRLEVRARTREIAQVMDIVALHP